MVPGLGVLEQFRSGPDFRGEYLALLAFLLTNIGTGWKTPAVNEPLRSL
jgi:hypothetical protein